MYLLNYRCYQSPYIKFCRLYMTEWNFETPGHKIIGKIGN